MKKRTIIIIGILLGTIIYWLNKAYDLNMSLLFICSLILLTLIFFYIELIKSSNTINILIQKLDPDKYIEETDKLIAKVSNVKYPNNNNLKYIEMLKLNKTAGLIYKGLFEEAQELFNSIDPGKVNSSYKALYEINYLCFLYSAGKIDYANRLYLEKQESIEKLVNNKRFRITTLGLISTYNFYQGNYNKSKELIIEMKKSKLPRIIDVECEYWLALIDIKQGNIEEGKLKLSKLLIPTERLYLNTLIKKELES